MKSKLGHARPLRSGESLNAGRGQHTWEHTMLEPDKGTVPSLYIIILVLCTYAITGCPEIICPCLFGCDITVRSRNRRTFLDGHFAHGNGRRGARLTLLTLVTYWPSNNMSTLLPGVPILSTSPCATDTVSLMSMSVTAFSIQITSS